ncbi:hypothetical protein EPI10_013567 [Gossypium australe]|uniref:Uncharacterized protein n=1 Tax=Gossypium australe TaxID=47621 RepID=A0A5B6UQG7_9ROSI|nr:hypothetical protein EPI10_013567 [Gossypium australe]
MENLDRMKQRIANWSTKFLSQGDKENFIKSVLHILWLVFYCLNRYVPRWKTFAHLFGGRRAMESGGFIDVLGDRFVTLKKMVVWGFVVWINLIFRYLLNMVGN